MTKLKKIEALRLAAALRGQRMTWTEAAAAFEERRAMNERLVGPAVPLSGGALDKLSEIVERLDRLERATQGSVRLSERSGPGEHYRFGSAGASRPRTKLEAGTEIAALHKVYEARCKEDGRRAMKFSEYFNNLRVLAPELISAYEERTQNAQPTVMMSEEARRKASHQAFLESNAPLPWSSVTVRSGGREVSGTTRMRALTDWRQGKPMSETFHYGPLQLPSAGRVSWHGFAER